MADLFDEEGEASLSINKDFAAKYQQKKEKEDLSKFRDLEEEVSEAL